LASRFADYRKMGIKKTGDKLCIATKIQLAQAKQGKTCWYAALYCF